MARFLRLGYRSLLPPLVVFVLLIGVWELYVQLVLSRIAGGLRLLPAPSSIAATLLSNTLVLAPHTWQTLMETVIGFALALAVGLGLAVVIDLSPFLRQAIYPWLVVSQTIPVLAIAPLMVLWFGFGTSPKVLIVGLYCFFPIAVAGARGLHAADPEMEKLFRTFGAGKWDIFRMVRFPGALPSIFAGIRIAAAYSVTGAIWGEYVGAENGLGIAIQRAQHAYQVPLIFAAIIVIAALSVGLFLVTLVAEHLTMPWYFATRQGSGNETIDRTGVL